MCGARIEYFVGWSGAPIVWLHGTEGNLGWLPLHEDLARDFTAVAEQVAPEIAPANSTGGVALGHQNGSLQDLCSREG